MTGWGVERMLASRQRGFLAEPREGMWGRALQARQWRAGEGRFHEGSPLRGKDGVEGMDSRLRGKNGRGAVGID